MRFGDFEREREMSKCLAWLRSAFGAWHEIHRFRSELVSKKSLNVLPGSTWSQLIYKGFPYRCQVLHLDIFRRKLTLPSLESPNLTPGTGPLYILMIKYSFAIRKKRGFLCRN